MILYASRIHKLNKSILRGVLVMKKINLQKTMIIVIIAGLMNVGIGFSGLGLYYVFDIPYQIQKLENVVNSFNLNSLDKALIALENTSSKIDSMTFPHELILNTNKSLSSIIEFLDISIEQMYDISNSFYRQAEIFWDLSILWVSPETMSEIGDAINELHLSIDAIIPSLQMTKSNITAMSSILTLADIEVEYFKALVSSILRHFSEEVSILIGQIQSTKNLLTSGINSLKMITPVVYLICTYFVIQGAALISISLMGRDRKNTKNEYFSDYGQKSLT